MTDLEGHLGALLGFSAAHQRLMEAAAPLVIMACGLVILAVVLLAPHFIPDLLRRPRLVCEFSRAISDCWIVTEARPLAISLNPNPVRIVGTAFLTAASGVHPFIAGLEPEKRIYARVRVKAGSKRDVEKCTATLRSISVLRDRAIYGGGGMALPFAPAERPNAETQNIRVGAEEWIDVFYLTANRINLAATRVYLSLDNQRLQMAPQDLIFSVRVMAPDCAPQDVGILLNWTGDMRTSSATACRAPSKIG
jgi:hypothetical protein